MTARPNQRDAANGVTSKRVQRICHDILPWLLSFSLDRIEHRNLGELGP
jgi:hypothetical protein